MRLEHLIFTLIFSLCAGVFLSLGALKPKELDRSFFVYHGLGVALVVAIAYLILKGALPPHGREIAVFVTSVSLYSFLVGRRPILAWVTFGIASVAALLVFRQETVSAMAFSNLLLSSLMLGFTLSAMLLGHWYLVQPRLSIEELKRLTLILIGVIALRLVFGTFQLGVTLATKSESEIYRYLLSAHPGVFVLMRWAWGLLAPALLSFLIWNTVKIRSTQSATGILYVAVVCVLSGEILSQYLMYFHSMIL